MDHSLKIGCVVMAAGLSSRFGRNKLLAEFSGANLASRTLDAVPTDKLERIIVVSSSPEIQALAETKGFEPVPNDRPEDGVSLTIRLGLQKLQDMDAALFMVCDQPMLTRASVSATVDFYKKYPDNIISMSFAGERGSPCIFPSAFFPELMALEGDVGGGVIIRKHEERLLLFEVSGASELKDVDYPSDMDESLWNT